MASLKFNQKQLFEKLFDREGYVLDFTNRTFEEFFKDFDISIYSDQYCKYGESKMKRLRAFWELESDRKVGEVLWALLLYADSNEDINDKDKALAIQFINQLKGGGNEIDEEKEDTFLNKEFNDLNVKNLELDDGLCEVLEFRIKEIQKGIDSKLALSVIFLCGSFLEGLLLGVATKNPELFNRAKSSPKKIDSDNVKAFHDWNLNDLINVSFEVGFLGLDVKKFSHELRDFRNYIHPYEQWKSKFTPNEHTAQICWQVLKASVHSINAKHKPKSNNIKSSH